MGRFLPLLMMVSLAACAVQPGPASAPDFDLPDAAGARVKGSELWKERPVLLVFMTSW